MSRLSFRPRPLDIHKKLPIVKSVKDFEDDDVPSSTRNSQLLRLAAGDSSENEVHHHHHHHHHQGPAPAPTPTPTNKKASPEIPTPQFVVVDTYERDYSRTFAQPTSYLRARGARAELGDFVEYDLDNEDEDWLQDLNRDRKVLPPDKFESLLFKLEVLDHKARERAGVITPTLGSPIPVLLQLDAATEALLALSIRYAVIQSVYNYWKEKRERWQKPILRRLQPPPPVNDTNPYNVFRPREKAHRLHTRRMQRRENNVQSFEKLRQVRRNLDQAKTILETLIKREEKKREVMETEVSLQRIQMKYKHETELLEDSLALPGFPPLSKFGSSEEEFMDSDDVANSRLGTRPSAIHNPPLQESNLVFIPTGNMKQELKGRHVSQGWLHKMDPLEPVLLFTRPLVPEKLAAAGIAPPPDCSTKDEVSTPAYKFRGRIGRGGRLIFDRWNPLLHTPIDCGNSFYIPPKPRPATYN
ncbi:enhancer of polycomb-like protein 1 [Ziziphus jujuba]|uniref:Enhancer of polycomb-like protein n=1 Tax=Ziziphus jujuba TaxID=326968 RepID=A0A6P3Z0D4_ZIZJJ|nr:enhancer of polycomb-like protein 1 [Ziziphus jujuba]